MFEETHNAPAQKVFFSLKLLFRDDGCRYRCRHGFLKLNILFSTTEFSVRKIMVTVPTRDVLTCRFKEDRSRIC